MSKIRRRLKRIETPGHGRYLTCSCYGRLPLFSNDLIKDAFVEQLRQVRARFAFELHAWVIMPEHFHLLIMPTPINDPKAGDSESPENDPPPFAPAVTAILRALKRPFATRILKRWRQLDAPVLSRVTDRRGDAHFWQRGGGYDRNIITPDALRQKIDYIHDNPCRRGLVRRRTDWRWSSATWYAGSDITGMPMDPLPL